MKHSLAAAVLLTLVPSLQQEAKPTDAQSIERAVLDYAEAFYETKPELIERSVHPDLTKFGYAIWEGQTDYQASTMTRDDLVKLANDLKGYFKPDAPKEVVLLDRLDKTAAAKLTAEWGVDYLHLAKIDGRWQIVQVLWQSIGATAEVDAAADKKAIERAVLDYVESAYEVKPENVDRSVHKDLVKLGFTKREPEDDWKRHDMDFDGLRDLVSKWNKDGRMPADARKEYTLLDHLDRTAQAKVIAHWGIDYFQLTKEEGTWKIRQVLWQSHPLEQAATR